MRHNQSCPLSVIMATHQAWPWLRFCLDALYGQARAVGAEIIVADGSGQALPEDLERLYAGIVWLKAPGASSFRLRALALDRVRGEIIAVTEDHCRVRPSWCERIIKAHRENPSAAAIGGAVENGSSQHLIDWAGFFIANGPFMLPLQNGETDRIALQANVSYKRRVIAQFAPSGFGFMEMMYNRVLRDHREKLVADDRIIVDHIQCLGFLTFCALHFHNGRCIGGGAPSTDAAHGTPPSAGRMRHSPAAHALAHPEHRHQEASLRGPSPARASLPRLPSSLPRGGRVHRLSRRSWQ